LAFVRFYTLFGLFLFVPSLPALTLAEALSEALANHPLLAVQGNRIESAAGKRQQAGLRPNPLFVYQTEDFRVWQSPGHRFWQDADHFLYLQQTFETAAKRARRVELAQANEKRAEIELLQQKQVIAARVRAAFWDAAAAAARQQLYQESLAQLDTIVTYHRDQVREGAMAEADLLRVELEEQKLQLLLQTATLDAQRQAIRLQREMGRASFAPIRIEASLESPAPALPDTSFGFVESHRAEALLARQLIQLAGAQLQLETALATPNVDGVAGYKRSRNFDSVIWGVQATLPINNRNQGNIASAAAEQRLARNALGSTLALLSAELAAALQEVDLRRQQLTSTAQPLRDRALQLSDLARAAYRLGGADLLRLLDAQRNLLESQQTWLDALAGLRQAEANLESVLGILP
jgi:cobalt-zinc-cadmium efflux system outer membrane protein